MFLFKLHIQKEAKAKIVFKYSKVVRLGGEVGCEFHSPLTQPNFTNPSLIKKKIKFSSYMRKFRIEQLQKKSYMTNGLLIGEIFAHFLINDFATAPSEFSYI
jgi:hypothetical protein